MRRLFRFTENFFPTVLTNVDDNGQTTLTTFDNSGIKYFGTVTISNAPVSTNYSSDMKQFSVTLNWTNAGIPRTRSLTTLVARSGIQNYVYY